MTRVSLLHLLSLRYFISVSTKYLFGVMVPWFSNITLGSEQTGIWQKHVLKGKSIVSNARDPDENITYLVVFRVAMELRLIQIELTSFNFGN